MTRPTHLIAAPLAAILLPVGALAQSAETGVKAFGNTGNAAQFGVSTTFESNEGAPLPDSIDAVADALRTGDFAPVQIDAVSRNTDVALVLLSNLDGTPGDDLDAALTAAQPGLAAARDAIAASPALKTRVDASDVTVGEVIGVYGAAATSVELLVDNRD